MAEYPMYLLFQSLGIQDERAACPLYCDAQILDDSPLSCSYSAFASIPLTLKIPHLSLIPRVPSTPLSGEAGQLS